MKKKILILIIILLFLIPKFAVSKDSTDQIELNKLFKSFDKIMYPTVENDLEKWKDLSTAIDYAVEILKINPYSSEAYSVIASFHPGIDFNNDKKALAKYKLLKQKHLKHLNDFDTDLAEKLITMRIMYCGDPGNYNEDSMLQNIDFSITFLKKMKKDCKDKRLASLASAALFKEEKEGRQEFSKNYPDHPAIPFIKLDIAAGLIAKEEYQKAIDDIKKICEQYKDVYSPEGWNFEIDCYETMIYTYSKKGDYESAQKLLKIVEENAPQHPLLNDMRDYADKNKQEFIKKQLGY